VFFVVAFVVAGATPAEHIAKGHELLQELEYEQAAAELMEAAVDPTATDEERIQANLLAGIAHRVSGHDAEATTCFRYVLLRKPDWQLADDTSPKVKLFFESIRQELAAEQTQNSSAPVASAASTAQNSSSTLGFVGVGVGVLGIAAVLAGSGGVVFAEASLADPSKPGEARTGLRSLGQWCTGGAAVGAALVAVGTTAFVASLP
jgi:hypothetical protein